MELDAVFLSLISVIIGFMLGWLKDYIQSKPKISLDIAGLESEFDYYFSHYNNNGVYENYTSAQVDISQANYISVDLKLIFFNTGKGDSAIKDVFLEIQKDNIIRNISLKDSDSVRGKHIYFNLPSRSIQSIDFKSIIEKIDSNEYIFCSDMLSATNGYSVKIVAKTINNQNLYLDITPAYYIPAK
ncbi:hypothetical protein [Alkalihalophilus marmarensis]|uniref:Uncharacterized protein n=1 Tax=Alkalihalophilus marmarensis DSM 21297 TaxID=1188261 RepID=U6SRJ7_9BACI|nr:hypothetical protein [Alkalihalophilus marmarensis]ERN54319.1 hypothetical protein A33I_07795 [Alkalihalophilus marmarensis DSM 21297]